MSFQTSERVCYVHCNFCNTNLAVSVPCSSMSIGIVTVRCGHCSNLMCVNIGALLQPSPHHRYHHQKQLSRNKEKSSCNGFGSSSFQSLKPEVPPAVLAPLKRPRVPSAYNRFIKEEIKRIKVSNPKTTHREAFSAAAKNWAHFPHIINFGLKLDETSTGL